MRGIDDVTGEPLVQRDDDKPECVRNRLAQYDEVGGTVESCLFNAAATWASHKFCLKQVTSPLVEYYNTKGVVETFHGTQSDAIYPEVKRWLEERTGA